MEHASLELLDARDTGNLWLMKNAPSDHDVLRTDLVATGGRDVPTIGAVIPNCTINDCLEQRVLVEIERAAKELAITEDFRCTRVALGGHVAGLFEKRKVGVGLNVTHTTGITVPVPSAAEVAALFHDAEIGDALVLQINASEHAGESATDDDDLGLFGNGIAGEVRISVGILIEFFELFLQT